MKYFITGGSGLIGRHLIPLLMSRGHEVANFDITRHSHQYSGDVLDLFRLTTEMIDFQPDTVIHLAAQSGVTAARNNPLDSINVNVMGTANVLEACRWLGIQNVITASSNHVYGDQGGRPSSEDSPLNHRDLYSATKIAADVLTQSYARCYGMNAVAVRNTNTYGPDDPHVDHIVPAAIDALLNGRHVSLRAGGEAKSYLFVEDCAAAYVFIAEHVRQLKGEAVNVVGSVPTTPRKLVKALYRVAGVPEPTNGWTEEDNPNEETSEALSGRRLFDLGWAAGSLLEHGLRLTWEWFKAEHEKRERADAEAEPVRG